MVVSNRFFFTIVKFKNRPNRLGLRVKRICSLSSLKILEIFSTLNKRPSFYYQKLLETFLTDKLQMHVRSTWPDGFFVVTQRFDWKLEILILHKQTVRFFKLKPTLDASKYEIIYWNELYSCVSLQWWWTLCACFDIAHGHSLTELQRRYFQFELLWAKTVDNEECWECGPPSPRNSKLQFPQEKPQSFSLKEMALIVSHCVIVFYFCFLAVLTEKCWKSLVKLLSWDSVWRQ